MTTERSRLAAWWHRIHRRDVADRNGLLAIDWDGETATVVETGVTGDRVELRHGVRAICPGEIWNAGPEQIGAWLLEQIQAASMTARAACVGLARDVATLKTVDLPAATDDELFELVQFQAAARSARPLDSLAVDFVALPPRTGIAGRTVLLASIATEVVSRQRAIATAAGLELRGIHLRPFAAGALVADVAAKPDLARESCVVVTRTSTQAEVTLVVRRHVVASHPIALATGESLAAGLSRLLASAPDWTADPITDVVLLGTPGEFESWRSDLTERAGCKVCVRDPIESFAQGNTLSLPTDRAWLAGAVGLIAMRLAASIPTIDFDSPRRAAVRRHPRALRFAASAALVLLTAAGFWIARALEIRDLDRRIADLKTMVAQNAVLSEKGQPLVDAAKRIDEWSASRREWLDEVAAFTEKLPPRDQLYLTELRLDNDETTGRARLKASGYARESDHVMTLNQQLLTDGDRYELQPHGITAGQRDPDFPARFEVEAALRQPSPPINPPKPPARPPESEAPSEPKTWPTTPTTRRTAPKSKPAAATPAKPVAAGETASPAPAAPPTVSSSDAAAKSTPKPNAAGVNSIDGLPAAKK